MPRISVLLSGDDHKRFVNAKMNLKRKSLQALMIEATEAFVRQQCPQTGEEGSTKPPTQESLSGTDTVGIELQNAARDSAITEAITLVSQSLEALRDIQESFVGVQGKGSGSRKTASGRGIGNRGSARGRGKD